MPIYEYVCTRCQREFEVIQGFSDKPIRKCEQCGGPVKKLVSQSAFHLKGTGWYVTDYSSSKRPGSKPIDTKDSGETKTTDSKPGSDSKTDSKSSSKTDTKAAAKPSA